MIFVTTSLKNISLYRFKALNEIHDKLSDLYFQTYGSNMVQDGFRVESWIKETSTITFRAVRKIQYICG